MPYCPNFFFLLFLHLFLFLRRGVSWQQLASLDLVDLLFLSIPFHVMKTVTKGGVTNVVAQNEVIIPELTIKDLLSAIPSVALPFLHVALC